MKLETSKISPILFWAPLGLCLVFWVWKAYFYPLHDFSNAYFAADFLRQGFFDSSIYDALSFNVKVLEAGFEEKFVAFYPNTPFFAFFFIPFTLLEQPEMAKLVFNILSVGLFLWALMHLQKQLKFPRWLLLVLPITFYTVLRNSLYFGQAYFLIFFLLTEGLIAYSKKKELAGGIYWGLAILLKVFPVLLGLLLLLKIQLRTLVILGSICLALVLFSLVSVDIIDWIYYLLEVFPKSNNGDFYDGFTPAAKSATMLFKNIFVYDAMLNPSPLIPSYIGYVLMQATYKTVVVGTAVLFSWKSKKDIFEQLGLWLIACMLLSPGWSSYASVLLLFPLVVLWRETSTLKLGHRIAFLGLIFLYSNIPLAFFLKLPLFLKFPKVYVLLTIFFYYRYLSPSIANRKEPKMLLITPVFAGFILLGLISPKPPQNNYVSNEIKDVLIADYNVQDGYLVYKYWMAPAPLHKQTTIAIATYDTIHVNIQNNQVYYKNQQLTKTKSNKLKPVLVNKKEVYYLSDQNRGLGFYTLLKIKLP
ncbi:MAG: DUF2029 domain-containing protein [Aureispira sp.]|nr:DUF2029 domain-containing protein [Aureispira sp.]